MPKSKKTQGFIDKNEKMKGMYSFHVASIMYQHAQDQTA
jgi:hypothetical protein